MRDRLRRLRPHRKRLALGVMAVVVTSMLAAAALYSVRADGSIASDGPGATAYFDLGRKDCLGTAQNTTSKVWYTVANGALSDVYYPTDDNTNVKSLQYIVTDGSTFTDLQTRDMTYTVALPDAQSLDCRVTATAKSGKYRIITDYLTDPAHNTVVMRMHFEPLVGTNANYQLYVRYDPTVNGNGGGGQANGGADSATTDTSTGHNIPVAYDTNTRSQAVNRDYAVPVYTALDASTPFSQVSSGFVGAQSDGLTQLDAAHSLTATYTGTGANNGNVVQTAQVPLHGGYVTIALGFGQTQADAVAQAEGSLATHFEQMQKQFDSGWHAYDNGLNPPVARGQQVPQGVDARALGAQYYYSANVLKASEDKTFPGAVSAGLAAPWGQAVVANDPNNLYFGSYREIFARDLYEAWTGFYLDGDTTTARDAVTFLFNRQQQADGSMPRNSLLNGKVAPDSFNTQLDEASYPIVMAYQMGMTDPTLYSQHIKPAANFVMSHGPSYGVERWEEQTGYSPSTISAEIAGLVAAASLAQANGDTTSARVWLGTADDWQRQIENWTVTTNGPAANHPYFIRLSKTGDPNAAISYNVGNGGPTLDQRAVIDAGFLELVRLGEKPANDPNIVQSLPVVDATIESNTSSGPGWHRYNGDGYGDGYNDGHGPNGHPWAPSGQGTGHVWPALSGERGEYDLAAGDGSTAVSLLSTMHNFASGVGLIPEQDWEDPAVAASPYGSDPTTASIGFQNGQAAGSAAPLTWSMGAYVRLTRDLSAGTILERPANTYDRYVTHPVGQTTLSVTSPANGSSASGSVTVTGTTAPGNTVTVAATNTDNNSATTFATTQAAADGSFSVTVTVSGGTSVLTTVATSPTGATAHDQRSVVYDFTPGTLVFEQTDPSNDDNGPGTYAYPTAGDFHAGAFDMQDFKVYDAGDTIYFKVQVRDLTPTFGSPLGAQLVDVYVHDPKATTTSTAAAYASRNYQIAPDAAWSQLLEVQGFGQAWKDATGKPLGTISISANAVSRYITFSVPAATLGHPTSGWGFTVTLTGQDGFSSDQARSFASTPQPYNFGVCAAGVSNPLCNVDPNRVPKVMDTLTPPGVSQADELNYLAHSPVTLEDVTIP